MRIATSRSPPRGRQIPRLIAVATGRERNGRHEIETARSDPQIHCRQLANGQPHCLGALGASHGRTFDRGLSPPRPPAAGTSSATIDAKLMPMDGRRVMAACDRVDRRRDPCRGKG